MSYQKLSFDKKFLFLGAILGLLGVILGAYGAHGLKPIISESSLQSYETGIKFQMYHALFALVLGCMGFLSKKAARLIYYFLLFGVICFSGSIYGLATNEMTSFDFTSIAWITPLGGLLLILAWLFLFLNIFKIKSDKTEGNQFNV